jgi:peptidyl-prolyl cis-trans isomerase B (cyclophilin B)
VQGGDPNSKKAAPDAMLGNGEIGYKVPAEINDSDYHKWGAVGMARDNNPEKASSACQFYIVTGKKYSDEELNNVETRMGKKMPASHRDAYKTLGGTPHLDGNYTVFGEVIEGMEVVERISNEPRNSYDRPNKDMRMMKVTIYTPPKVKKKKRFLFF